MKKNLIIFTAFLFLVPANGQDPDEATILKAMHTVSSHDLMGYLLEQCDDKYEGRLTGTPGYQACAEWLAGEFSKWGLTPGGDNGGWFQWFTIPYTLVLPECGLSLNIAMKDNASIQKHYRYISEFMPGSTSGNGVVTGEVVYAGYGITAPELGYDDYAKTDVRGKIILIEPEAPVSPGAGPEKFNPWYEHSFHQSKLANAVRHGAAGMIYNYGPIANPNNDYAAGFIYVHVGDSVVKDIFSGTGLNHDSVLRKINSTLKPASFSSRKSVTIRMSTRHIPDGKGSNVIGMIRGSDPLLSREAVIIGAHLDHLGRCYDIIPGANDNASAVAVMMGVAKTLAENKIPLKRSVVFAAFGAEEQAIMGSKAYLDNPVMPLEKSVLINLDGVGIGHSIRAAAGTNYPKLWSFIGDANEKYIHRPLSTGSFSNLGRPRLDAARFMKAGVPSLSFSTYGSVNYYHVPMDDPAIIRPEIMEDLAQLLVVAVINMANSPSSLR